MLMAQATCWHTHYPAWTCADLHLTLSYRTMQALPPAACSYGSDLNTVNTFLACIIMLVFYAFKDGGMHDKPHRRLPPWGEVFCLCQFVLCARIGHILRLLSGNC